MSIIKLYVSMSKSKPGHSTPGTIDSSYAVATKQYSAVPYYTALYYISGFNSSWTPGVFYTYFYNHAHRLRLEKLL